MDIEKLIDMIRSNKRLTKSDKDALIAECNTLDSSPLLELEAKHPMLVSCIDLLSRTLSRLGI